LPVPDGDKVIRVANALIPGFKLVLATQDWHPADHGSFAANHPGKKPGDRINLNGLPQILWPTHCVQNTPGAAFASELNSSAITRVFQKGTDAGIDSYSGFFDNGHRKSTGLAEYLRSQNVTTVFIAGLATDYCVKFTALDAVAEGFRTKLLVDGCGGVELHPGDVKNAVDAMIQAGVEMLT
jgi:nicotinamidase/pyrazinamidase